MSVEEQIALENRLRGIMAEMEIIDLAVLLAASQIILDCGGDDPRGRLSSVVLKCRSMLIEAELRAKSKAATLATVKAEGNA